MNIRTRVKHAIEYLNDQSVDIRIRMMYFLEYAALAVCFIGSVFMILLKQPMSTMFPNIFLFINSFIGIYLSKYKKKYDLALCFLMFASANVTLPWMFFVAGGNNSGMQIWFIFGVLVMCMLSRGRQRILFVFFTIIEDVACICIGEFYPKTVMALNGERAVFIDQLQSFSIVCICLTAMLIIYIITYDIQRKKLEEQSLEMKRIMYTDALTGMYNRYAYYDEISRYTDYSTATDLIVVAMDVNGLKKVNDEQGHSAGDEYICGAADVIGAAVGDNGNVFRTGGDEFIALLHCGKAGAQIFEASLNRNIAALDNPITANMTIAVGIAGWCEMQDVAFDELEKAADARMYENKALYYRKNGIDRRNVRNI